MDAPGGAEEIFLSSWWWCTHCLTEAGRPSLPSCLPSLYLYNLEKKMSLITNMLGFRCWIVDDNDAEIIIIRTSLIGPTYVPRYLQRISMETGKTPWGCQRKARSKEFNLQTRRQPGCQHKSERKEFKKGTICRYTFLSDLLKAKSLFSQ